MNLFHLIKAITCAESWELNNDVQSFSLHLKISNEQH